jgi:hypothetical protein
MIISDLPHHKISAEYNKDGFLHITAFHQKSTEWVVKTIGLSPETQAKLVEIILEKERNEKHISDH